MRFRLRAVLIIVFLLIVPLSVHSETVEPWSREHPEYLRPEHLHSEAAILVDGDTGEILFEKNAHSRMFPASTTKIMTLLLALESGIAPNEEITIPSAAGDIPEGSSVVPVYPGEQMRFKDLLYGFMLKSGNDGANAIAVLVSGSIPAFVERMNEKAASLGCTDTHFTNAHGYHNNDHYSTAADLAIISREAMKNEAFRAIVATSSYTMPATTRHDRMKITCRNELINPDSRYYYPDCVGIKTGFHSKAGQCLVGGALRDGKLLISVTLNSDGNDETLKWYDTAMLFEYGYTLYETCSISELARALPEGTASIPVSNAAVDDPEGGNVDLRLTGFNNPSASVPVLKREAAREETMKRIWNAAEITLYDAVAPIDAGQTLGSFACTLPTGEAVTASLAATRAVSAQPAFVPEPAAATAAPSSVDAGQTPAGSGGPGRLERILLICGGAAGLVVLALIVLQVRENARRREAARRKAARKKAPRRSK